MLKNGFLFGCCKHSLTCKNLLKYSNEIKNLFSAVNVWFELKNLLLLFIASLIWTFFVITVKQKQKYKSITCRVMRCCCFISTPFFNCWKILFFCTTLNWATAAMSLNTLLLFWQQPFCLFYTNALGSIKFRFLYLFFYSLSLSEGAHSPLNNSEKKWKTRKRKRKKEESK